MILYYCKSLSYIHDHICDETFGKRLKILQEYVDIFEYKLVLNYKRIKVIIIGFDSCSIAAG